MTEFTKIANEIFEDVVRLETSDALHRISEYEKFTTVSHKVKGMKEYVQAQERMEQAKRAEHNLIFFESTDQMLEWISDEVMKIEKWIVGACDSEEIYTRYRASGLREVAKTWNRTLVYLVAVQKDLEK